MNERKLNIRPESVFGFFEDISGIYRCSGEEKGISDFMVDFAKKYGLECYQDKMYNIIIKKPGTPGYENAPTVILQGHLDMVCEKNTGTVHDFETEKLKLYIDGDFVKAEGTSLGADNGIALAYTLALLSSDKIAHPPIEAVFTTEEETGMGGAATLDTSSLKGRIFINMDSEEEGELCSSCAGGVRNKVRAGLEFENVKSGYIATEIKIRGLKGGHSGIEIDQGRANANKVIGRVLNGINSKFDIQLVSINGGAKMNAIPREADTVFCIAEKEFEALGEYIGEWREILKNELKTIDPDFQIEISRSGAAVEKAIKKQIADRIITMIVLIPNGVQTMSSDIKGLVQSSTNIGIVSTGKDEILFESAVRSSVRTLKTDIVKQIETLSGMLGFEMTVDNDYPEWEFKKDSRLRNIFTEVYKNIYGREPKVTAIHAGLECGIFKEKLGDIDMISIGPNMFEVHTPFERLSISSTARTWEYFIEVMKEIKNY